MERDEHVKSIELRLADAQREVRQAQEKVRCINVELKDAMQQVFEQRLGVKDASRLRPPRQALHLLLENGAVGI